jgi:3-oxoacyl-[acyl-carrier-protein] synthase II
VAHAGLDGRADLLENAGACFGAGYGARSFDETSIAFHVQKTRRVKPTTIPRPMPDATAAQVSIALGVKGPTCTHNNACVSSSMAIDEAIRAIRDGYLNCVIAGGAQASLSEPVLCNWGAMAVLASEHPDGPGASVRPFDQARTGFALGEGAAVLVLECEDHAQARGAKPLAQIVGYGASSDAFNIAQPSEDGQARALIATLADAGIPASERRTLRL